jgi:DNA-binding CsgD family transcriptional regulator
MPTAKQKYPTQIVGSSLSRSKNNDPRRLAIPPRTACPANLAMRQFIREKIAQAKSGAAKCTPNISEESGLILMDPSLTPIAFDRGAGAILSDSNRPESTKEQAGNLIPEEILEAIRSRGLTDLASLEIPFRRGTKQYLCRPFVFESRNGQSVKPFIALYLESDRSGSDVVEEFAGRYNLTEREQEALGCLSRGLTSKEVAERMGVSVNTIKAFLRQLMMKMGVSTRSEVLAKLLQNRNKTGKRPAASTQDRN